MSPVHTRTTSFTPLADAPGVFTPIVTSERFNATLPLGDELYLVFAIGFLQWLCTHSLVKAGYHAQRAVVCGAVFHCIFRKGVGRFHCVAAIAYFVATLEAPVLT